MQKTKAKTPKIRLHFLKTIKFKDLKAISYQLKSVNSLIHTFENTFIISPQNH